MIHAVLNSARIPLELVRASWRIASTPKLLRWCLLPWLLGGLTSLALIIAVFYHFSTFAALLGLDPGGMTGTVVGVLGVGVGGLCAALGGYVITVILGSFFFDHLIEEVLAEHGVLPPTASALNERIRRFLYGLVGDGVIVALIIALTVVGMITSLIPPLVFLSLGLGAVVLGFEMFDKPLVILGSPLRSRLRTVRHHPLETVFLGALGLGVAVIPFANLITLPVFYLVATERVLLWQKQ